MLHIVRVTPWPPTRFFGVLRSFWGLEGSIGVRLQCLGSQKIGKLSLNSMQTKNKFLVTPNFQGPWSSKIGPWGFRGSCGVKKTILTPFSAQNNPWFKKQNFKNLLPSMKSINGSQKRGPLPWNKGQAHFQTWAYFSPMICGKHPTKNFYPNTSI